MHHYTPEQVSFIEENVVGLSYRDLTEIFNKRFSLELRLNQIRAFSRNHKLTNGLDGGFKPGNIPLNKGRKGVDGWAPTQFKKGNKTWNCLPVGTERLNGDGNIEIKVADPGEWKTKHVSVWESVNGPVPNGHVVIFGDRNNRNFEPSNLILVSRKQLAKLNQHNLIQDDADLTRTGVIIADIYNKIGERKKGK